MKMLIFRSNQIREQHDCLTLLVNVRQSEATCYSCRSRKALYGRKFKGHFQAMCQECRNQIYPPIFELPDDIWLSLGEIAVLLDRHFARSPVTVYQQLSRYALAQRFMVKREPGPIGRVCRHASLKTAYNVLTRKWDPHIEIREGYISGPI
jgi:hypothetical protein